MCRMLRDIIFRELVVWKNNEAGLVNRKPISKNPTNPTPSEMVEKVLPLRQFSLLEAKRFAKSLPSNVKSRFPVTRSWSTSN